VEEVFLVVVAPFVIDPVLLPVAVGTLDSVFVPVSAAEGGEVCVGAAVELLLESCLTIRESSSGSHRGHGHAETTVERYKNNTV